MYLKFNHAVPPRGSKSGFTLAEVMVAVGVLGVSFISLYAGIAHGFAVTRASREDLRATQVMLEVVEGIRLFNWNQANAAGMIPTNFTRYYQPPVGDQAASGVLYRGTISVSSPTLSPQPTYTSNLRQINVEVRWNSGGAERVRRMSTLFSMNGLQNYVFAN
jgi:prepilin-type N-terminal cleavage/methylation domain-containing protein